MLCNNEERIKRYHVKQVMSRQPTCTAPGPWTRTGAHSNFHAAPHFECPATLDVLNIKSDNLSQTTTMSGPAFGFSAGDFISAVTLIVSVTKALKDAGGASDEYRSLTEELDLLQRILKQLHARQGTAGGFDTDVKQQADLTLATLSSFLKTISKFDSKLGGNAQSGWRHGAGRKAQWAVIHAKEVDKLRVKVGAHLSQLNLLLQLQSSTEYVYPFPTHTDRALRQE